MKKLILLITALSLTGCVTNGEIDYGKTGLLVGAIIVGGIAASQGGSTGGGERCYISVTPQGSNQVCPR